MNEGHKNDEASAMMNFIRDVLALPPREAGSEGERMAQAMLAGRLDELGMSAVVAGAVCAPRVPVILGLHSLFFLWAAVQALFAPGPLAFFLSAITLLSFWGELRGSPRLLRKLLLKRITCNMVARAEKPSSRGRLILVAHSDVAATSSLLLPWARRLFLDRELPGKSVHPGSIVLIAGVIQLFAAAVQWSRDDLSVLVVVLLAGLLGAVFVHSAALALALDWWRSPPQQGAVNNASGLAVTLAVAQQLERQPLEHLELWVVASGARQPDAGGMKGFLYQFSHMLDRDSTWFVNLEGVGRGELAYAVSEGRWRTLPYRPSIPAAAERVASQSAFRSVRSFASPGRTDAGPPTRAGHRALTLSGLVDGRPPGPLGSQSDDIDAVDGDALLAARDFTVALLREIDSSLSG